MNIIKNTFILVLAALFSPIIFAQSFSDLTADLGTGSFSDKAKAIKNLATIEDPRVLPLFTAMQGATLYLIKDSNTLVFAKKTPEGYALTDVLNGNSLGEFAKAKIKKIRINNRLRRALKTSIAILELSNPDVSIRLNSARRLAKNPKKRLREVIITAIEKERGPSVRHHLDIALSSIDIYGEDPATRIAAAKILGSVVEPEAVAILNKLLEKDENGKYIEENTQLTEYVAKQLKVVNSKLAFYKFFENLLFGMSLGSVLLLAAIGLAITFGVMGVINMAHGEMIMLGAYTTFAVQQLFPNAINMSLLISIPAAFLVSGLVGIIIERLVIRHLYGRPLDTLLATFGISLILQQAVRMYNSNNVPVITPDWMSGFWAENGAMSLTYNRIYILVFSLFVLGLLALLLKKTMMGLQMRAVTQNRPMANAMGIRSNWIDAMTFGLGSGIAGIAGVALSQITNVGPNLGQGYIIDSFMVVVFGGVGNLLGTFFAAMSLGIANKFLEPYAGAVIGKIIVLIFIILFIQWRPRGLFALKGRFVED